MADRSDLELSPVSRRRKCAALAVHVYTALGLVCSVVIAAGIFHGDYRLAFLVMTVAVLIDSTDGVLARKFRVKEVLPEIDGARLDDIVDYINYTLLPLLLVLHASEGSAPWLPEPAWAWICIPLVASAFAFCHSGAKDSRHGFFRGFPSYWNVFAFYVAVLIHHGGPGLVLGIMLVLSLLSVLPVRFAYPTHPPRWPWLFLGGGAVWLAVLVAALVQYPDVPMWLVWASLIYPAVYVVASIYLDLIGWQRE